MTLSNASVIFLLLISASAQQCSIYCQSCFKQQSPYSCTSCQATELYSPSVYIWSCQQLQASTLYIIICVLVVVLYVFMLAMGFGVYRDWYESIQLVSLMLWGYSSHGSKSAIGHNNKGLRGLQGTNFGIVKNNNFNDSFAWQFIVILVMCSTFWILVFLADKIPHSPTSILIKRKRIIFPVRLLGTTYNMLLFCSLVELATVGSSSTQSVLSMILAIMACGTAAIINIGFFFVCNFKAFKLDDPHYYVITEKMKSTRWWVKNSLYISMVNHTVLICAFVLGFSSPSISGIINIISQSMYTLYSVLLIPYVKKRYTILLCISNLLFLAILVCLKGIATTEIGSNQWSRLQTAYTIFILISCIMFMGAQIIEIVVQRTQIQRQIRSLISRYVICHKINEEVQMSRFDDRYGRERVVEFQNNLVYGKDISTVRDKLDIFNE